MSATGPSQSAPAPDRPWFIATCNFGVAFAALGGVAAAVGGWMDLYSPNASGLDNLAFGLAFYPVVATVALCIVAALCCAMGGGMILQGEANGARLAAAGAGILLLPLGGWSVVFFADGSGWWLATLGVAALVAMMMVVDLLTAKDLRASERTPIIRSPDRS